MKRFCGDAWYGDVVQKTSPNYEKSTFCKDYASLSQLSGDVSDYPPPGMNEAYRR